MESRKHGYGTAYRYGYTTNAAVEYSLSGFQAAGTSNYKIKFWNDKFKILRNTFYDRYEINYNNESRTSLSKDITGDTYAQFCATIYRAAYRYCYGDNLYLKRPSTTSSQMRLYARNAKLLNPSTGGDAAGSYGAGSRKIYIGRYMNDAGALFR